MDKIINILLLIIIFVFDPLAISLVVAANFAFDKAYPRKKYRKNLYEEKIEITEEDINTELFGRNDNWEEAESASLEVQAKYTDWEDEAEKRMNIIGQNGNDGEHYEEYRLNKKLESLQEELNSLPKTKQGNYIGQEERRLKIEAEIQKLRQIIK